MLAKIDRLPWQAGYADGIYEGSPQAARRGASRDG